MFKAYRKEYKKRFAWIKAGRITDEQFYAWSEQAREMKKKCDREVITLDEFKDWLGETVRTNRQKMSNGDAPLGASRVFFVSAMQFLHGSHVLRLPISESTTPSHRARC